MAPHATTARALRGPGRAVALVPLLVALALYSSFTIVHWTSFAQSSLPERVLLSRPVRVLPTRDFDVAAPVAVASEAAPKPPARSVLNDATTHAWQLGTLMHLVENGTRVQGAFIAHVNASFVFSLTRYSHELGGQPLRFTRVDRCSGMKLMPCTTKRYTGGDCRLCSEGHRCIAGELHLAASMLPGHFNGQKRTDRHMRLQKSLAWARVGSREPRRHAFFTVVASCELREPFSSSDGVLTVDGVSGLAFTVSRLPVVPARAENILCGRILFGQIKLRRPWVEHYLVRVGLDRVVVFDAGMGFDASGLDDYLASGRVVVVDLRDELQRVHGMALTNVALYSTGMAQALSKVLCLLRARHLGARWTLHFDLDEVLMPGINASADAPATWADVEREHAGNASFLMFTPTTLNHMRPICSCALGNWTSVLASERDRHHQEWARARPLDPFDCAVHRADASKPCSDTASSSKVALRVDGEHYVHPAAVGNHHIFFCAKLSPSAGCFVRSKPVVVPPTALYLRHYNCLNLACDRTRTFVEMSYTYTPPWWSDADVGRRITRTPLFPRLARLKTPDRLRYQIRKMHLNMSMEEYSRMKAGGGTADDGDY